MRIDSRCLGQAIRSCACSSQRLPVTEEFIDYSLSPSFLHSLSAEATEGPTQWQMEG